MEAYRGHTCLADPASVLSEMGLPIDGASEVPLWRVVESGRRVRPITNVYP